METKYDTKQESNQINYRYRLHEKPPLGENLILGLQQVLTMISGNVFTPMMIAAALAMTTGDMAFLIQCAVFTAGATTFIQAFGIGPVGSRLPIAMGVSFAFVAPSISIATSYGFPVLLGAFIICGLVEAFFGRLIINKIKLFFPPMVVGSVILVIGLTSIGNVINFSAGGDGSPIYGSMQSFSLAIISFLTVLLLNQFAKGFLKSIAVFIGLIVGTIVAAFMGLLDFGMVLDAAWFEFPQPLKYGIRFSLAPTLVILLVYFVSMLEFIGDTTSCALFADNRKPTAKELSGGIMADGLGSAFSGLFNCLPNVSFSNCIGMIPITGVASRYVTATAGIMLALLGFCPKVSMAFSMVPSPVMGGAGLMLFGYIISAGLKLISQDGFGERNMVIIAISVAIGLGFFMMPQTLANAPFAVQHLLSGVAGTAIFAVVLNLLLPGRKKEENGSDAG